jgi:hypothetical protein
VVHLARFLLPSGVGADASLRRRGERMEPCDVPLEPTAPWTPHAPAPDHSLDPERVSEPRDFARAGLLVGFGAALIFAIAVFALTV